MIKKNNICKKLLITHIKNYPKLMKSFDFTYSTQKYKLEDILDDVIYIMKYNIPYRAIRSNIKWQAIYKVYRKLLDFGIFKNTFRQLLEKYVKKGNMNKKLKFVSTDTTFIMNKKGSEKIGLNKYYYKKKGNKISLIIDAKRRIIDIKVYKGGKNDGKILEDQLNYLTILNNKEYDKYKKYFLCDAGYDSKIIHDKLKELTFIPLIAQNKRGIKNKELIKKFTKRECKIYCNRTIVENVISNLKQLRRINNRYDSLMKTYEGYVFLGAIYLSC
jgi:hypothetical protein